VPKINLTTDLICRDYFYEKSVNDPNSEYIPIIPGENNPQCRTPAVQSKVAQFELYMNLIMGTFAALVSPRLGRLSDVYGRTKIIALCGFGTACSELVTCIVGTWPNSISVNVLLLGSLLDGLSGSLTGAQVILHSYATDCTTPDRRSVAFGLFHGALFLGVAVGPSGAAYIIYKTGTPLIAFYLGMLLHLIFALAVLFIVPESLSKASQLAARARDGLKPSGESRGFSWKTLNPMNLLTPLSILYPPVGRPSALFPNRKGASPALRRNLLLLAMMDTVIFGVALGAVQVIVMYARYAFNWGDVETSMYVAFVSALRTINLFVFLPLISWYFRKPAPNDGKIHGCDGLDVLILRISTVLDVLGFIGYGLSRTGTVWVLSGVVACLGSMGPPTIQSAITKHVHPNEVGQLLGATGLLHALAIVVAPTVLNLVYSFTVGKFTQAVFVTLSATFGSVFFLSFFVRPHGKLCFFDMKLLAHG
jgi:Major Facilitator Superfamily